MLDQNSALLIIDVQQAFNDGTWGARNNPNAEARIGELLAAWRLAGWPVLHVRHESLNPLGRFHAGAAGYEAMPQADALKDEPIYTKTVNSAFIGTSLEADLRQRGINTLVLVGLTTNHCVSTTARMAGNLGFETFVVSDATAAFDRAALDGARRPAEDVHMAALSDLQEEFASVVDSAWLLDTITAATAEKPRDHHAAYV